jgi:hypothetical protein
MFKIKHISLILIGASGLFLASCEDVIQLDLTEAATRIVVDGSLNATDGVCHVHLSRTLGFYTKDSADQVVGATVELIHASGSRIPLAEVGPGLYRVTGIQVDPGERMRLSVTISDDEKYLAETLIPQPVFLDSLNLSRGIGDPRPGGTPVFLLRPEWRDPSGVDNYYRFKVIKNGELQSGFNITSDRKVDGTILEQPLFRYFFELGDTVHLEFQSIDSVSYSYFNQINDMARPSFVAATPYNPIGNFDNGALGYFGVYYSEVRDLIVKMGR